MNRPPEHPGIELEKRIQDMKMTYAEFARTTNISPSTISELVSGKRSLSIESAEKISNFFDMDIEYWLSKQMRYDIMKNAKTCMSYDNVVHTSRFGSNYPNI